VFEGLNAIPWVELSHAYGSAEEVPVWVRRLISPRRLDREQALNHLYGSICHQGSVYSATAPIMPFLLEVLDSTEPHDAVRILDMLADIAIAHSWWDNNLRDDAPFFVEERKTPEFQQQMLDDRASATRARESVRTGMELFGRLLYSEQAQIRMRSAQILASFRERQEEKRSHLLVAYANETDPVVRAFLLYLLRTLKEGWEDGIPFFTGGFVQAESDIVRLCAALALLEWQCDDTSDTVITFVVESLCRPADTLISQWYQLPRRGHLTTILIWLYFISMERLQPYVPLFIARMNQVSHIEAQDFAILLLAIAFYPFPESKTPLTDDTQLTALQRGVIKALLDAKSFWKGFNFDMQRIFQRFGLPDQRQSLAALVNVSIADDPPSIANNHHSSQSLDRIDHYISVFREAFPDREYSSFRTNVRDTEVTQPYHRVTAGEEQKTILRYPLTITALADARYQVAVLHALKDRLPAATPAPLYTRLDTDVLGNAFWGYALLPGIHLTPEMLMSMPDDATRLRLIDTLGQFLIALHSLPLMDFPVPLQTHSPYAALVDLVPTLPISEQAKISLIEHIRSYQATAANHDFTPAVIHGTLAPAHILYDAHTQNLGGIVHWDTVGLGDPAMDLGALASHYDEAVIARLGSIIPMSPALMKRIQFFAGISTLRRMLAVAAHVEEQVAFSRHHEDTAHYMDMLHEDLAYEEAQIARWWHHF
jgi:aminoglycoside phosphotransferase (APT) family kinase protein